MSEDPSVFLSIIHGEHVSAAYMNSLVQLVRADTNAKGPLHRGMIYAQQAGTGQLNGVRNNACRKFLETECDYLLFIDCDQTFDPDIVWNLVYVAQEHNLPVLSGVTFSWEYQGRAQSAPYGEVRPVAFAWNEAEQRFAIMSDIPSDALMKVSGMGAACLLIRRDVIEHLQEAYGDNWFSPYMMMDHSGCIEDWFSEDMSFMRRLLDHAIDVHCHTGILLGHHKSIYLNTEVYTRYQRSLPNIVVLPVKNNLHYTQALLRQLIEQDEYDAIWVYDNGSTDGTLEFLAEFHDSMNVDVVHADGWSIHQMWNHALDRTKENHLRGNICFLNNDIRIGTKFLSGLAGVLRSDWNIGVVGANYDNRPGTGVMDVNDICAARYDGTGGLPGFAFMIRSGAETPYRFPEPLGGGWWFGDNDLVLTHLQRNSRVVIAMDTTCEHLDGGSRTGEDWSEFEDAIRKDKEVFFKKWGMHLARSSS